MRATLADLIWSPRTPCGETEQHCVLMRTCACCGFTFVSARNRRQHQNQSKRPLDGQVIDAQHDHLVGIHRIRQGRNRG